MSARSDADLVAALVETVRRFDTVDRGRVQPLRQRVIALDTARDEATPLELPLQGNFLYADDDTDGKLYVRLGDEEAPRIPVGPGFVLAGIDFRRVFLDWTAQPNRVCNLVYGIGANLQPPTIVGNINSIGSIASAVEVKSLTAAGALNETAFASSVYLGAAVGEYPHIGLVNTSSDRNVIVTRLSVSMPGTTTKAWVYTASETDMLTTWGFSSSGLGTGWPLYAGNAASSAVTLARLSDVTGRTGNYLGGPNNANGTQEDDFLRQGAVIVLPPGQGVFARTPGVNINLNATFTWLEVEL